MLTRYIQQQSTVPHIREGSNDVARMEDGDNSRMVSDIYEKKSIEELAESFCCGGDSYQRDFPHSSKGSLLLCGFSYQFSAANRTATHRTIFAS